MLSYTASHDSKKGIKSLQVIPAPEEITEYSEDTPANKCKYYAEKYASIRNGWYSTPPTYGYFPAESPFIYRATTEREVRLLFTKGNADSWTEPSQYVPDEIKGIGQTLSADFEISIPTVNITSALDKKIQLLTSSYPAFSFENDPEYQNYIFDPSFWYCLLPYSIQRYIGSFWNNTIWVRARPNNYSAELLLSSNPVAFEHFNAEEEDRMFMRVEEDFIYLEFVEPQEYLSTLNSESLESIFKIGYDDNTFITDGFFLFYPFFFRAKQWREFQVQGTGASVCFETLEDDVQN